MEEGEGRVKKKLGEEGRGKEEKERPRAETGAFSLGSEVVFLRKKIDDFLLSFFNNSFFSFCFF